MSLLAIIDKQIRFILSLGDIAIDKRIRFDINVTRKPWSVHIIALGLC